MVLWQAAQIALFRCIARKSRLDVAVMTSSDGSLTVSGGGGGGAHIRASRVQRPRATGEVRFPREVASCSAPKPQRPPRWGVVSDTRVKSVPATDGKP